LDTCPGIGQPLALLLKTSPFITELALFDIVPIVKGDRTRAYGPFSQQLLMHTFSI
jgi:hypothetical protein